MNFAAQLRKQLGFLRASCEAYDRGSIDEAVRIALSVRVLLHDTSSSVSLLSHLNAKRKTKMLSTATTKTKKGTISPWGSLTFCELKPAYSINHHPHLVRARRKVLMSFDDWWTKEPIFALSSGMMMYRRGLILGASNKDGGAHVDTRIDAAYEEITKGHGLEMEVFPEGSAPFTAKMMHGHLAAIRQIGFEVLNTPGMTALALMAR